MAKTHPSKKLKTTGKEGIEHQRGVIIATAMTDDDGHLPCALLRVGGITLLERHVRLLRALGIQEIVILASGADERLEAEITRLERLKVHLSLLPFQPDGHKLLVTSRDTRWVVLDGAALIDHRLPSQLAHRGGNRIAVVAQEQVPPEDATDGLRIDVAGHSFIFAGCAHLTATGLHQLRSAANSREPGDLLVEMIQHGIGRIVDIDSLPTYLADMRKDLAYYWLPVHRPAANHRGKKILLDAAQKGVLDWPAWYVHRPIEKWIVSHLCEWPLTPNQLTLLCNLLAFLAVYLFASGSLLAAILIALGVGILDGVDGKQARVKQMTSRFGKIEHVCDSIYEYAWLMAIASRLGTGTHSLTPYFLCAIIIGVDMGEKVLLHVFECRQGVPLDDFRPVDRSFRLIIGRRNTYMWTLLPFIVFDALYVGYWALALYALGTLLERLWRVGFTLLWYPARRAGGL